MLRPMAARGGEQVDAAQRRGGVDQRVERYLETGAMAPPTYAPEASTASMLVEVPKSTLTTGVP